MISTSPSPSNEKKNQNLNDKVDRILTPIIVVKERHSIQKKFSDKNLAPPPKGKEKKNPGHQKERMRRSHIAVNKNIPTAFF